MNTCSHRCADAHCAASRLSEDVYNHTHAFDILVVVKSHFELVRTSSSDFVCGARPKVIQSPSFLRTKLSLLLALKNRQVLSRAESRPNELHHPNERGWRAEWRAAMGCAGSKSGRRAVETAVDVESINMLHGGFEVAPAPEPALAPAPAPAPASVVAWPAVTKARKKKTDEMVPELHHISENPVEFPNFVLTGWG